MMRPSNDVQVVYLSRDAADFRKRINGLSVLVEDALCLDPFSERKALNYLNNEWIKLVRYLDDGRLEINNNLAENAIRPFVVGRKNSGTSKLMDSLHNRF